MPSLQELRAQRAANEVATKEVVAKHKTEAEAKKRSDVRAKQVARATGAKPSEAEAMETIVGELAELLALEEKTRFDIRRAHDDEVVKTALEAELSAIEAEITSRTVKGDREFLTLLANLKRAEPKQGALLYFGQKSTQLGYFEVLDASRAKRAIEIMADHKKARELARKEGKPEPEPLSPEQHRNVWAVGDPAHNTIAYFRVKFFDPKCEADIMAKARMFGGMYNELHRNFREARADRQEAIAELERQVTITIEDAFEGKTGIMKFAGLTKDSPWTYAKQTSELGRTWGVFFLDVIAPFVGCVILPEGSGLVRTTDILGLTEPGIRKEFRFNDAFDNLQAQNGERFKNPGATRKFLCMAAGVTEAKPESPTLLGEKLGEAIAAAPEPALATAAASVEALVTAGRTKKRGSKK